MTVCCAGDVEMKASSQSDKERELTARMLRTMHIMER